MLFIWPRRARAIAYYRILVVCTRVVALALQPARAKGVEFGIIYFIMGARTFMPCAAGRALLMNSHIHPARGEGGGLAAVG